MLPIQRVTLDSNVLVSALAIPHGVSGQILDAWQDNLFDVVLSDYIVNEVRRILETKFRLQPRFVADNIVALYQLAEIFEPDSIHDAKIEDNDFPILGTATAGHVNALITEDLRILKLKCYHTIRLLSPRQFLDILF